MTGAPDAWTSRTREVIRATVEDLALDLLIYDRRDDEDLPTELLHEVLERGVVTPEELVVWFSEGLRAHLVELDLARDPGVT